MVTGIGDTDIFRGAFPPTLHGTVFAERETTLGKQGRAFGWLRFARPAGRQTGDPQRLRCLHSSSVTAVRMWKLSLGDGGGYLRRPHSTEVCGRDWNQVFLTLQSHRDPRGAQQPGGFNP